MTDPAPRPFLLFHSEAHAIMIWAQAAYPEELGGFVFVRPEPNARRELLVCENASPAPREHFQFYPWDCRHIEEEMRLNFRGLFWHSHPDGSGRFSRNDRRAFQTPLLSQFVPMVVRVISVGEKLMMSFHGRIQIEWRIPR